MKLSEIEGAGNLVSRDDLEIATGRIINRVDERGNKLESQFHKELIELVKWMAVMGLGFATVVLGGVYFMLSTMLAHWKP
jgi:hypothetical protein